MVRGRRDLIVRGACPRHGEDVSQTLEKCTFTEARSYIWDCPHEEEGNESVQVIEIVDAKTGNVEWSRPFKKCNVGGIPHIDYDFDC
jgi:hypothetical protein